MPDVLTLTMIFYDHSVSDKLFTKIEMRRGNRRVKKLLLIFLRTKNLGPYLHAVLPNQYLLEGGQTTAGSTLDWLSKLTSQSLLELAAAVENLRDIEEKSDVLVIADLQDKVEN